MRKIVYTLLFTALTLTSLVAQEPLVTEFLGIPIDGSKAELLKRIKEKGFVSNKSTPDILEGEFNGQPVLLQVATYKDKAYRVFLMDAYPSNEANIKVRFNTLCQQFNDNPKYTSFEEQYFIPMKQPLSSNARYEAHYYVSATPEEQQQLGERLTAFAIENYTQEELADPTDEVTQQLRTYEASQRQQLDNTVTMRSVWFIIVKDFAEYRIAMYYDNCYNQAKGEDL